MWGLVGHVCNHNTQDVEAKGPGVQRQTELHTQKDTVSKIQAIYIYRYIYMYIYVYLYIYI